jgi:hypothetical protein
LFKKVDITHEPKYSIVRFMVANPLPMVLNPGLWYEFKKWLGFINTDSEREIIMTKQWDAYVEWCIKNVLAQQRSDENPDKEQYISVGNQLLDEKGQPLMVEIKEKEIKPILNVCPDFGILDTDTSRTPMFIKIFGGIWYEFLGDNLWGFIKGTLSLVIDLLFKALDLIGKVINTVLPSLLLIGLSVGLFMIGLTYFEESAKESADSGRRTQTGQGSASSGT